MKTHLNLTELATEITRRQNAKVDMVADTKQLAAIVDNGKIKLGVDTADGVVTYGINDIAHDQIASRLEIPAKYYRRMLSESPQLLADNVNHWFQTQPQKRLVRTLDGNARAFLSDRYQRIENEEIASIVLPVLLSQEGVRIASCSITESRMYIKAVFETIRAEVKVGDVVLAGVAISNSEVGQGAVDISPFMERLVCTNGLIIKDARFSARHVGGRITANDNDLAEILSSEALQADDRAILLKARDVLKASFDQVRFAERVKQMTASTEDKMTGNPVEAVKILGKKAGLTEGEQNNILRHLIEGADLSRYGLLNAVTRSAQDSESYDRATELETLGGNILNFTRKDFEPYALAA